MVARSSAPICAGERGSPARDSDDERPALIRNVRMGKGHAKLRLSSLLVDSEFIDIASGKQDARKTFRAVRKRQMREAELRMRRAYALRKKLGIK